MNRNLYRATGLAMLTLTLANLAAPTAQAATNSQTTPMVTETAKPTTPTQQPGTVITTPVVDAITDQAHVNKHYIPGTVPTAPAENQPGYRIQLDGSDNTRDMAGYTTADGKWQIRPHRLIRSAHLGNLSDQDLQKLSRDYHVKSVVDFRTSGQVKSKPDKAIPGAKMTYLSILGPHAYADNKGDGEFYNQRLEFGYAAVTGYRQFLNDLLTQPEATLFHCSSGKDRTGIAAVLIMSALGVDRNTILKDYMLSQTYHHTVKYAWIQEYFREVELNYGNMDNYLTQLIEFGPEKREQLRAQYLVSTNGHTPYPAATMPQPVVPVPTPTVPEKPQPDVKPAPAPEKPAKPQTGVQGAQVTKPTHHKRPVIKIVSVSKVKKFLVHLKPGHHWFHDLKQKRQLSKVTATKGKWTVVKQAKVKVNGKQRTYVQVKNVLGQSRWVQLNHVTRV